MNSGEKWVNTMRSLTNFINYKDSPTELKNAISEIKKYLIKNRLDDREEQISELKDKVMKITKVEQKKKLNEQSLRHLGQHYCANICIIQVAEREEKGAENIFEKIIAENSPYQGQGTHIQVQDVQNPKQNESKEFYNKTKYNSNGYK